MSGAFGSSDDHLRHNPVVIVDWRASTFRHRIGERAEFIAKGVHRLEVKPSGPSIVNKDDMVRAFAYDQMDRLTLKTATASVGSAVSLTQNTYDQAAAGFYNIGQLTTSTNPAAT
ncbi:hypothetical protein [Mesorhizobium sp.]|uniref:hypothetical protein n=1 Tax=Mesorhizobium sp. TaxID=1871066 RepID=UPI0025F76A6D|nr:hypothetical protein [Mesorhizobium sp.]